MKKKIDSYKNRIAKKFKSIKRKKNDSNDLKEVIELIDDNVIEVNSSGSKIRVPLEKIVMIKKKALQSVFYLISNEKIVSDFRFEDLWVLLPSNIFEKSNDGLIFQKSFI